MNGMIARCVCTLVAGLALVVSAQASDCETYARYTLQQVKENVDRGCKFTGPRWSLDVDRHRAWCQEVGPAGWREELKLRKEMLEGCKG